MRTSGESAREGSVAASRRSLAFGSRHSMASAVSASSASGLPGALPGSDGIRSSGTYRRAEALAPIQSALVQPMPLLPQSPPPGWHSEGGKPSGGGRPRSSSSDEVDDSYDDSSGTHHGSGAALHRRSVESLPEGLQPGGVDVERGITYEGGVWRHTGDASSDEGQMAVTAEGHWPGKRASMASAACAPLQTH